MSTDGVGSAITRTNCDARRSPQFSRVAVFPETRSDPRRLVDFEFLATRITVNICCDHADYANNKTQLNRNELRNIIFSFLLWKCNEMYCIEIKEWYTIDSLSPVLLLTCWGFRPGIFGPFGPFGPFAVLFLAVRGLIDLSQLHLKRDFLFGPRAPDPLS